MKLHFNKLLLIAIVFFNLNAFAQHKKCKTMELRQQRMKNNPELRSIIENEEQNIQNKLLALPRASERSIITIPVVVHVIYHNLQENISDAQILSQLNILNNDFRMLNSDTLPISHPFGSLRADSQIEFCLAQQDPNGNPTNGIIRTCTDSASFAAWGYEKFSQTGGQDSWDANNYLNLWVCNLGGSDGVLGYATFPSDLTLYPYEDGVVIHYENFGDIGTVIAPYDLGRTLTHEVGHWLNLYHIWGDSNCGDDLVSDTPASENANTDCPSFPKGANNSCGANSKGEMFMNYMDYVNDNCMNMFTTGQVNRMYTALNADRNGILTSAGCVAPPVGARKNIASTMLTSNVCLTDIKILESEIADEIEIYPNPSNGKMFITLNNNYSAKNINLEIFNVLGDKVLLDISLKQFPAELDLTALSKGIYFITVTNGDYISTQKIILY